MSGDYMFYEGQHWVRVSNNQMETDVRAIHREAFLAVLCEFVQNRESDINEDVQNARKVANEVLRQWPAACEERDRIIAELEGGAS